MRRTLIKTCGITSPEDACTCAEAGADFLGLIFAYSPRRVTIEQARAIRAAVPAARLAGVFGDDPAEVVLEVAADCGLDLIQLHGGEWERGLQLLERTDLPVVQALPGGCDDPTELDPLRPLHGVLFDFAKGHPVFPGTREALWDSAAQAVRLGYRVYLAGGLDADTVDAAIVRVGPFCVDVARGVERAPGVKDCERVRRFIAAVDAA